MKNEFRSKLAIYANHTNARYVSLLDSLGLSDEFDRAEGATVYCRDGRCFIDCIAGYGNLNVGHNHPKVVASVVNELKSLRPFSWPFISESQIQLVEKLSKIVPPELSCSFIVNSGTEAVDNALKLIRLITRKPKVVSFQGAWHGFTMGALSVSDPGMCRTFRPLLSEVVHVPFGDVSAVEAATDSETGALIVEPIQGESGVIVPPNGYLRELARICRSKDIIFVVDEVKTGVGKTGRMFAFEYDEVVPDIIVAGKSLGGGVMPIGALIAKRRLWGRFGLSFPMSSSSAAGNAPACRAALATLEVVEEEQLCRNASEMGDNLLAGLQSLVEECPNVFRKVSGRGLLVGLHASNANLAFKVVQGCIQRGVLVMTSYLDRSRIIIEPPLCITKPQIDNVTQALRDTVADAMHQR
jgi:putrescine aminotransferase